MRISCVRCGRCVEPIQVSPDYDKDNHRAFLKSAKVYTRTLREKVVDAFILSESFAQKFGINCLDAEMPRFY